MIKVILDANFLLVPFQFKIDILDEIEAILGRFEPTVLSTTLEEIQTLSENENVKTRIQARASLSLIKKCTITNVEKRTDESFDDVILRIAVELKCPVATNDIILRKRLREVGLATIFLRQKSHLEVEGHVPITKT